MKVRREKKSKEKKEETSGEHTFPLWAPLSQATHAAHVVPRRRWRSTCSGSYRSCPIVIVVIERTLGHIVGVGALITKLVVGISEEVRWDQTAYAI